MIEFTVDLKNTCKEFFNVSRISYNKKTKNINLKLNNNCTLSISYEKKYKLYHVNLFNNDNLVVCSQNKYINVIWAYDDVVFINLCEVEDKNIDLLISTSGITIGGMNKKRVDRLNELVDQLR